MEKKRKKELNRILDRDRKSNSTKKPKENYTFNWESSFTKEYIKEIAWEK